MITGDAGTLTVEPATDVAAVAARCAARIVERAGIPMFVALRDARAGARLDVVDPVARSEGDRLAALFEYYRASLDEDRSAAVPERRPPKSDPTGAAALIDVLVVLSDQHLRSRAVS